MSLFHCLGLTKGSPQARSNCIRFVRRPAGGPTLVGCPRLLIQYIRIYRPFWRSLLLPQPEDALRRGDRDQLKWSIYIHRLSNQVTLQWNESGNTDKSTCVTLSWKHKQEK